VLAKSSGSDPTAVGENGMLADIEIQPITAVAEPPSDPTADIKQFLVTVIWLRESADES
jgi:hypothetical protein